MRKLGEEMKTKFEQQEGDKTMCVCHYCKELCFKATRITVYYPVEERLVFYHPKCYAKMENKTPQIVLLKKDWRKE